MCPWGNIFLLLSILLHSTYIARSLLKKLPSLTDGNCTIGDRSKRSKNVAVAIVLCNNFQPVGSPPHAGTNRREEQRKSQCIYLLSQKDKIERLRDFAAIVAEAYCKILGPPFCFLKITTLRSFVTFKKKKVFNISEKKLPAAHLLCISTSFRELCEPKSWSK